MLDAGDQDAGGTVGGAEFAAGGGFFEELMGFVTSGFGVGQDGGECGPAEVVEDPLGMFGFIGDWDVLLTLRTNEFAERAHVGQLHDHTHRMGLLLAAHTPESVHHQEKKDS